MLSPVQTAEEGRWEGRVGERHVLLKGDQGKWLWQRLGGGEGASHKHLWVEGVRGRGDSGWTVPEAAQCLRPGIVGGWARSRAPYLGRPEPLLMVCIHFRICWWFPFFLSPSPIPSFPSFFASFSSSFQKNQATARKKVGAWHHPCSHQQACEFPWSVLRQSLKETQFQVPKVRVSEPERMSSWGAAKDYRPPRPRVLPTGTKEAEHNEVWLGNVLVFLRHFFCWSLKSKRVPRGEEGRWNWSQHCQINNS